MPTDSSLGDLEDLVPEPSGQDTPSEVPPASVEDTPSDVTELPEIDWEDRYKNLQSFADQREAERLAELEETKRQLEQFKSLEQRQPTQPRREYDDDVEYLEPPDMLADPRVQQFLQEHEQLKAQVAEREQREAAAAQRERDIAHIDAYFDRVEEVTKVKVPPKAATWIGREALSRRDPVTGAPDIEGAYAEYRREIIEAERQQWVNTKPGRSAAGTSGPGAVEVPDLDDPDARAEYLDRLADQALPPLG